MNDNIKYIAKECGIDLNQKTFTQEQLENLVETLSKAVAKDCMDAIVANVDAGKSGDMGWWTIRDTYDVNVEKMEDLLPANRIMPQALIDRFHNACLDGNIKALKECFSQGASICYHDNSPYSNDPNNAFLDTCRVGGLNSPKTLDYMFKHFKEDAEHFKDEGFNCAFTYNNLSVLRYFLLEHEIEKSPKTAEFMNDPFYLEHENKSYVDKIISVRDFNKQLVSSLNNSDVPHKTTKKKI